MCYLFYKYIYMQLSEVERIKNKIAKYNYKIKHSNKFTAPERMTLYHTNLNHYKTSLQQLLTKHAGDEKTDGVIGEGECRGYVEVRTIDDAHGAVVNNVSVSSDSKFIVSCSDDKTVRIWNMADCKYKEGVNYNMPVGYVSFTPVNNNNDMIITKSDGTIVLANVNSDLCRTINTDHKDDYYTTSSSFSPDGESIVSNSTTGIIKIWNLMGDCIKTINETSTMLGLSASFSGDSKSIVSSSDDKTIKIWNADDAGVWKCIHTLTDHKGPVRSALFSPDGKFLVSSSDDKSIKIWNVDDAGSAGVWKCIHTLTGHTDRVTSASFSPNGKFLVSSSDDKSIKIWNVDDAGSAGVWKCIHTLTGHTDRVTSASFSPNCKTIVSSSYDKTIKIWNVDVLIKDKDE